MLCDNLMCHWRRRGLLVVVLALLVPGLGLSRVIYVDDDAPFGGDGLSWDTACRFLQDGLAMAESGDEIRVAQGIYKPDQDGSIPGGRKGQSSHLSNSISDIVYILKCEDRSLAPPEVGTAPRGCPSLLPNM